MTRNELIRAILVEAAQHHGVTVAALKGPRRYRDICLARWRAMFRLRSLRRPDGSTRFSLPQIGEFLALDHTTVLHGIRRYSQYLIDAGVDKTIAADEWTVDIHREAVFVPVHVDVAARANDSEGVNCSA